MQEAIKNKFTEAIMYGEEDMAVEAAEELVAAGEDPIEAVNVMGAALNVLGDKFQIMEVFLPEIVLAADAMKAAMKILEPEILKAASTGDAQERIGCVMGTVKGDVHQVGKDMVSTMLMTVGFDVKDLGPDVAPSVFMEEAAAMDAKLIGASALMSTTLPVQKDLIEFLQAKGLRDKYKVMVGGGVASAAWAEEIGADGYALDAVAAIEVAKKLMGMA